METTDHESGVDTAFDDLVKALDPEAEEIAASDDSEAEETNDEAEEKPKEDDEADDAEKADTEEVEFDGKTLKIPKGTPPELVAGVRQLAHDLKADYTKKTQEVSEGRRDIAARLQAAQQQEQLLAANFQRAVDLRKVQERLSQYENIDWQTLADQDPAQATKLNLAYQQTQREAQKLHADWNQGLANARQLSAQAQQQAEADKAKALQDCAEWCKTNIKGFNVKVLKGIDENARSYGYSGEELSGVNDPRLMRVLHDAYQWQKLQRESPEAMKKVAIAPRAVKPTAAPAKTSNKAAFDRLKAHGRAEDLAAFL